MSAIERDSQDNNIFLCPSMDVANLVYRFTYTYGVAKRLGQEMIIEPNKLIWFLWKDEYGNAIKNEKNQALGTQVRLKDVCRVMNKLSWRFYQELEERGYTKDARDLMELYERTG